MPRSISSSIETAKDLLRNVDGMAWLIEFDADGTNALRITSWSEPVTAFGQTWTPFPMQVDAISTDSEGNLPLIRVTVSNVLGDIGRRVQDGEFDDRLARIWIAPVNAPSDAMEMGTWKVISPEWTLDSVTFPLSMENLFGAPFPAKRFSRTRCTAVYGSRACGYDKTLTDLVGGDFDPLACDFTKHGPNGCEVHGDNEAAHGLPRRHPLMFNAQPGIPKGRNRF